MEGARAPEGPDEVEEGVVGVTVGSEAALRLRRKLSELVCRSTACVPASAAEPARARPRWAETGTAEERATRGVVGLGTSLLEGVAGREEGRGEARPVVREEAC